MRHKKVYAFDGWWHEYGKNLSDIQTVIEIMPDNVLNPIVGVNDSDESLHERRKVITVLETGVHLNVFVDVFTEDDSAKASASMPCASPSQTVLHIPSCEKEA